MNKALRLCFILLFFSFCGKNSFAQEGFKPKLFNVHNFEQDKKVVTPELNSLSSKEDKSHPEYGVLPYNTPCQSCMELIHKRTINTRYFVKKGTKGTVFYQQQYDIPLNIKDTVGRWVTVDPRLKPNKRNPNVLEAPNQFCPVSFDLTTGRSTIKSWGVDFNYNENLRLGHVSTEGDLSFVDGPPKRSVYSAGSDGIRVNNLWYGVDLLEMVDRGRIETNFVINNKPDFFGQSKWVVIEDKITLPDGFNLKPNELMGFKNPDGFWQGDLTVTDAKGTHYIEIYSPKCLDAIGTAYEGGYDIIKNGNEFTLRLYVDANWLNSNFRAYPVVIDPIVVGENHIGDYNAGQFGPPFVYANYGFSGPAPNVTCDTFMTVTVPGKSQLTACYLELEYETYTDPGCGCDPGGCGCKFYNIQQTITGPCNSITLQCDTTPWQPVPYGTCTTDSNLILGAGPVPFASMITCVSPQCGDYQLDFTLKNHQNYCPQLYNGSCGHVCANGHYWGITIKGTTLQGGGVVVDNNPVMCVGDSLELIGNGDFGVPPYTWTWQPGNLSGQDVYDFPTNSGSVTYTVTVTDACGDTVQGLTTANITVNPPPLANAGPDIELCEGFVSSLGGGPTGPPGSTYQWTSLTPGGQNFVASPNSSNPPFNAAIGSAGTYTYVVEVTKGCSSYDTVTVVVHPNPNPVIVPPGPFQFCEGGSVTLDAGAGYSEYNWASSFGLSGANAETLVINQSGTYTCQVTDSFGCKGVTQPVSMLILPTPHVYVDASPGETIYEGESVQLNANSNVSGTAPFIWQPDPTLSCDSCPNPIATPTQTTTYFVSLTHDSCIGYSKVTIKVIFPDAFEVPNAFSPNGDGRNETFYLLEHEHDLVIKQFRVFNRWGEKVWDNPSEPWDGKYKGKEQPLGVFVYYFVVGFPDGTEVTAKGNVTLIR